MSRQELPGTDSEQLQFVIQGLINIIFEMSSLIVEIRQHRPLLLERKDLNANGIVVQ